MSLTEKLAMKIMNLNEENRRLKQEQQDYLDWSEAEKAVRADQDKEIKRLRANNNRVKTLLGEMVGVLSVNPSHHAYVLAQLAEINMLLSDEQGE